MEKFHWAESQLIAFFMVYGIIGSTFGFGKKTRNVSLKSHEHALFASTNGKVANLKGRVLASTFKDATNLVFGGKCDLSDRFTYVHRLQPRQLLDILLLISRLFLVLDSHTGVRKHLHATCCSISWQPSAVVQYMSAQCLKF